MALMRRPRNEVEWPELFSRRFFDWPTRGLDLFDEAMKVEEFEEDGYVVVRAEMPGIDPDKDVDISIADGTLHVRAERREENRTEDTKGYRSEFRYGSFSRSIPLPPGATDDDVKATYTDGILEVRVPVPAESATATKVPIVRG